MIIINNQAHVPSELVEKIKKDPEATKWYKSYPYYLVKINASNSTFKDDGDFILRLASYVMGEPKQDKFPNNEAGYQNALANYRDQFPTPNSAIVMSPLTVATVNEADRDAINYLLTNGYSNSKATEAVTKAKGITNPQVHQTDPETGWAKSAQVEVIELYINGPGGRRVTIRTETVGTRRKVTYYYSSGHNENTYQYQRLS